MLKFFRRIRKTLLAESKFSKYLVYAIGEIILVVIGIVIALQLNEWNDDRKNKKLENEYYCRLLDDVLLDEEQIRDLRQLAEARLTASNAAARLLLDNASEKADIADQIALSTRAIYSDFEPNNSAFEDLKSGANLNIIRDKSVIKNLNHYFNRFEELKSIIMINGTNGVNIFFAHQDYFANGYARSSLREGRLKIGLDDDLKEAIRSLDNDKLTSEMRSRLLNESLEFVGTNTRQIELYDLILEEVHEIKGVLERKCMDLL